MWHLKIILTVVVSLLVVVLSAYLLHNSNVAALDSKSAANELIALTNVSRTSNGLRALLRDNRLITLSISRSEDMISRRYFSHEIPPNDTTVVDVLESLGVRFGSAGENIAWNNSLDFTTVQTASTDFMNSPHHRVNVLHPTWDRIGAGVAQGGDKNDKKMYTVVFMQMPSSTAAAPVSPMEGAEVTGDATSGGSAAIFVAPGTADGEAPSAGGPPQPSPDAANAAPPRARGEKAEVVVARTGLIDDLVNRLVRLFLNL